MIHTIDYKNWVYKPIVARGPSGHWRTEALFLDTAPEPEKTEPFYTFREYEVQYQGKTLPSAYQIILYSNSEYDAAMRLLGSYRHWERLKKSPRVFTKGVVGRSNVYTIEIALKDMHLRLQSEAKEQILVAAKEGSVPAAKTVYEGGPLKKEKASASTKESKKLGSPSSSILESIDKYKQNK